MKKIVFVALIAVALFQAVAGASTATKVQNMVEARHAAAMQSE